MVGIVIGLGYCIEKILKIRPVTAKVALVSFILATIKASIITTIALVISLAVFNQKIETSAFERDSYWDHPSLAFKS